MNPMTEFIMLAQDIGSAAAARRYVEKLKDAHFDKRMGLAFFIASFLGHEFEDRDPPVLPEATIDEACMICRRRLVIPFDRPGIEGTVLESECSTIVGSRAEN